MLKYLSPMIAMALTRGLKLSPSNYTPLRYALKCNPREYFKKYCGISSNRGQAFQMNSMHDAWHLRKFGEDPRSRDAFAPINNDINLVLA